MSEFLKVPPPFEGPYWISLQKSGLPPSIIVGGEICEVIGMENDWSKERSTRFHTTRTNSLPKTQRW